MSYRVGIVGSGFGGTVHAPAFARHPQFEPVAIASPNRARQIAEAAKIPHAFASVEEMLAQLGDGIDVVSVASPPFDHHRSVMAALAAGKHVLCEKPFSLTLAEGEEMAAAAQRAGVANATAFEFRYAPGQRTLRKLRDAGTLGPLREVVVLRLGKELRAANARPGSSWWYDGAQGGGIANAFMPHLVDMACFVSGSTPQHASGLIRTANAMRPDPAGGTYPSTASDGAFAIADFGDGLIGRITVDGTTATEAVRIILYGEKATAKAAGTNLADFTVTIDDGSGAREVTQEPLLHAGADPHPSVVLFLGLLDDFALQIAGKPHHTPTFADGLAAQRVLAAIGYPG